jgi:hypothetical protein
MSVVERQKPLRMTAEVSLCTPEIAPAIPRSETDEVILRTPDNRSCVAACFEHL